MLAINGVPFDKVDPNEAIKKHIKSALTKIKTKKFWRIKYDPKLITPPRPGVEDSFMEAPAGNSFLSSQKYSFDGMDYDLAYYTTMQNLKNSDSPILIPRRVDYRNEINLDSTKEADLIFFFTCILPFCGVYEPIEKYQNVNKRDVVFIVEDLVSEAKKQDAIEREFFKFQNAIYGDNPLKDEEIRTIAAKMKVPGSMDEETDISIIKRRLRQVVVINKNGSYDSEPLSRFNLLLKETVKDEITDLINEAINAKILKSEKKGQFEESYYAIDEDKKQDVKLIEVIPNEPMEFTLYDLFKSNESKRKAVEKLLNQTKDK